MQKKAYSYIRFSSAIQQKGDSLRRQLEASRAYAKKNNLILDESLRDVGVSAFEGKNATEGALKKFLELIEKGRIEKGSILILESLDRLSRQEVLKTLSLFTDILSSGVEIVTLADNQHYTEKSINDVGQLMFSLISMSRAHEESAIKAKRGKAAWDNKRKLALEEKKPMTKQCPRWLTVSIDGKKFEKNTKRIAIIHDIFNRSIAGKGQRKIASELNTEGVEPFTMNGIWNYTYIKSVLENRALLGEFQPKHKGSPVGEVITNYYPKVISEELFYQARAATSKRLSPSSAGRHGKNFPHLFKGMCKCAHCNATFRFIKGNGTAHLRCSNSYANSKKCDCHTRWYYKNLERSLLLKLSGRIQWLTSTDDSKTSRQILEEKMNAIKGKIDVQNEIVTRFEELFMTADASKVANIELTYVKQSEKLTSLKEELKKCEAELLIHTPQSERDELLEKNFALLINEVIPDKLTDVRVKTNRSLRDTGLILFFDENEVSYVSATQKEKVHLMSYGSRKFDTDIGKLFADKLARRGAETS